MEPELFVYEALAKEILKRCMAEESVTDLHQWLTEQLARLGGGGDASALMTWPESFDFSDALMAQFEVLANTPASERRELTWPWASWNTRIDQLEAGMLGVIAASDGAGKTLYAESITEHWAQHKHKTVFVHYELNRKLMMLRRLARHTSIDSRAIKEWRVNGEQIARLRAVRPVLEAWDGEISYLHTPGWTMERTVAELRKLKSDGLCDVVVLDYLEKTQASRRQLQMFGTNGFQRETDDVNQLKDFAESSETPVLMLAQLSKAGKRSDFENMDRTGIRGAGEKSERANLVVMLYRERVEGRYANEVDVQIDKQTMGPTGAFRQYMRPEYYQVADIAD